MTGAAGEVTFAEQLTPEQLVTRMRDLLHHAADGGFSEVELLRGFLDFHHQYSITTGYDDSYYEKLDIAEHDLTFTDETYDFIVARYDELGGEPQPDTWQMPQQEEVETPQAEPLSELEVAVGGAYVSVMKASAFFRTAGRPV